MPSFYMCLTLIYTLWHASSTLSIENHWINVRFNPFWECPLQILNLNEHMFLLFTSPIDSREIRPAGVFIGLYILLCDSIREVLSQKNSQSVKNRKEKWKGQLQRQINSGCHISNWFSFDLYVEMCNILKVFWHCKSLELLSNRFLYRNSCR